jgi:hypothetical protein
MFAQVKARCMFPFQRLAPHGLPLLGWLRGNCLVTQRQRSYAALRLPCCLDRRSGFPSSPIYHGANACCEPARRAFADAGRIGGFWVRGLRQPRRVRGQTWVSQVTWPSSSNVPRSSTPPRETPPRPVTVTSPAAFRVGDPLGFPGRTIPGLHPPSPAIREPCVREKTGGGGRGAGAGKRLRPHMNPPLRGP